jgi:hypothetical protein
MAIKVTFEFATAASAAAFLQDFDSPREVHDGDAPIADKPRRGRPPKAAPVEPAPAATLPGAPSPAPAPVPATPAPAPAISSEPAPVPFAALVEPLTTLADKDLDTAVAILGKFGVKTARELKPEQFGAVLAEVTTALNKPAARTSLI